MHGVLDLVRTVAPATRPLSLDEVKLDRGIEDDDHDTLVESAIDAAVEGLDGYAGDLGRALITQTWKLYLDRFPPIGSRDFHGYSRPALWSGLHPSHRWRRIALPLPPLISVTSIHYVDPNGVDQVMDPSLYVVRDGPVGCIDLAYGAAWPSARCQPRAISIIFVAGYGPNPEDVPAPIRAAMKLMIGGLYEVREDLTAATGALLQNPTLDRLLSKFRLKRV
jgi:hypothetical protein